MKEFFCKVRSAFAPILQAKEYERGTLLQVEDDICYNLFLVEKGALRSFYFLEDKDISAHFAIDYGVVGAVDSIIKGKKSRYNIEALESCEVKLLDYRRLETFLDENPHLERMAHRFTQYLYLDLVERFEGMMFLSAKEKYEHLLQRYPGITQRVSLGHIASYLGMSQETLSRVRALK